MVTLGNDYSAGYGHVAGPVDRFKAKGGKIVQQLWVPYGTADYAPYLTALKKADVFFQWTVMPDLLVLLKQYYAYAQGYRTMVTLGNDYSAGYGHVAGPVDRFKAKGGKIVQQLWVPYGTADYAPYLTALKKADVFFQWTVMPDLLVLLKQYYQYGVKIPLLIGEAEGVSSAQLKEIGPKVIGLKGILRGYSRRLDNPVNHKFVAVFKAKYGRYPGQMDGFAYSCMSIYLAGLEATGGDARLEVLRPAILKLTVDTPVGPVAFSKNGYALSNRYLAEVKVIDGEYVWEPMRTIEKVRDPRDK
jgi:branched-chain amino acid transport system substrate-binding protein